MKDKFTFDECFKLYMLEIESNCKKNTINRNRSRINYFIKFYEELHQVKIVDAFIDDITREDLIRYQLFLRNRKLNEDHPLKPEVDEGLKESTIHDYIVTVLSFFRFCRENEYTENDPGKNFKIIKASKSEKLPLYQNEVDQIEKAYNPKTELGARNIAIIHTGIDAGLRSSEIINLKVKDVNFDSGYIFINNSKWARSRYVPISYRLKKYLLEYYIKYRGGAADPDAPFFSGLRNTNALTKNSIKMMFQRLRTKTNISRLHAHLLRHTFASSFILGGGDVLMLANLLGHSDIKTTQGYVRMSMKYKSISDDIYRLDGAFIDKFYYRRGYDG